MKTRPTGPLALLTILLAAGTLPRLRADEPIPAFQYLGSLPTAVGVCQTVIADFNGDRIKDVAVTNHNSGSISVLLGKGDGTFHAPLSTTTGSYPRYLGVGDFNRDGRLDLVTSRWSTGHVTYLAGKGDGTFEAPVDTLVTGDPMGLAVADFNGDGKLDVVTAQYRSQSVSVLLGQGDGTFASPITTSMPINVEYVVTGDFNGDGKQDVATVQGGHQKVSMLAGRGDGTFEAPTVTPLSGGPSVLATADLTGDGLLDLVVGTEYGKAVVLTGKGDGTFTPGTPMPAGTCVGAVALGDLDGDGVLDLALTDKQANAPQVITYKGDGIGGFTPGQSFKVGAWPWGLTTGDLDGDGMLDIAVAEYSAPGVGILVNRQAPPLGSLTSFVPATGRVGTEVTLQGKGFYKPSRVTFGGVEATYRAEGLTSLKATVPVGATTGHIEITTPAGVIRSETAFSVLDSVPPTLGSPVVENTSKMILFRVNATDNTAVARVEFWVDGRLTAQGIPSQDTPGYFGVMVDSTQFLDGNHTLYARAYDAESNQAISAEIPFRVNNQFTLQLYANGGETGLYRVGESLRLRSQVSTLQSGLTFTYRMTLPDGSVVPMKEAYFTPLQAGLLTVVAEAKEKSGLTESATLTFTASPRKVSPEYEPNNSPWSRWLSPTYQAVQGTLSKTTDVDCFYLSLAPGETLRLDLTGPNEANLNLALIGYSSLSPLATSAGPTSTESLEWRNAANSTEYVSIRVKAGPGSAPTSAPYTLLVTRRR